MAARTAKPVVKVEVAEGGVEIVAPKQVDDTAARPYAFRIAGRPTERALGIGEVVGLLSLFAVSRISGGVLRRRRGVVGVRGSRRRGKEPERGAQSADDAEQTVGHDLTWLVDSKEWRSGGVFLACGWGRYRGVRRPA